jgi:hypothetical protein
VGSGERFTMVIDYTTEAMTPIIMKEFSLSNEEARQALCGLIGDYDFTDIDSDSLISLIWEYL